jgi:hypothetical protein
MHYSDIKRKYTFKFGEHVEKSFQSVDINSRNELEDIAKEEKLDINFNNWWDKWNELVEKTKQDITNLLEDYKKPQKHKNGKPFKTVYVYNLDSQLIGTFDNPILAARHFDVNEIIINQCMRNKIPYFKQRLYFSNEPINEQTKNTNSCIFK